MNRLKQLRDAKAALVAEANAAADAALARAITAGGGLTTEEDQAQAAFNGKLAALDAQLRVAEQMIERTAALAVPVPDAGPVAAVVGTALTSIEVGSLNVARDPMRGFTHIGEFAQKVKEAQDIGQGRFSGKVDERLLAAPTNYHQTANEGAEIPPKMRQGIWELVFSDPLLGLIDFEPTDSPVVQVIADETTPWGATGVQARWRSEASLMTADKLVTKMKEVRVHELYSFALVPEELLDDAPRLADRLNRKMPQAIQWTLVEAFVTGTGAGQPLGWLSANYAGKIAVTRAVANQIAVADITGIYKRLLAGDGADRSFWLGNRDIISQLLPLAISNQPVWLPPNGLAGAPNGTLLGRPLIFSDHAEALGTAGDLQLINPAGYYALVRGAAKQDSSMHLYFDYAITAFRVMTRFGGQPLLGAAVTAAKGPTKSHFVHIAA